MMLGSTGTTYNKWNHSLWVLIFTFSAVVAPITASWSPAQAEIIDGHMGEFSEIQPFVGDDYSIQISTIQTDSTLRVTTHNPHSKGIDTKGVCRAPGFKRNETDCAQFYRCFQFNITGDSKIYTIFRYTCGPGTVFDEKYSVCTWPHLAHPPCELCTSPGFRRNATDCTKFYRCVDFNMEDNIKIYTIFRFSCGPGTVFDEKWFVCTWPHLANPPCPKK